MPRKTRRRRKDKTTRRTCTLSQVSAAQPVVGHSPVNITELHNRLRYHAREGEFFQFVAVTVQLRDLGLLSPFILSKVREESQDRRIVDYLDPLIKKPDVFTPIRPNPGTVPLLLLEQTSDSSSCALQILLLQCRRARSDGAIARSRSLLYPWTEELTRINQLVERAVCARMSFCAPDWASKGFMFELVDLNGAVQDKQTSGNLFAAIEHDRSFELAAALALLSAAFSHPLEPNTFAIGQLSDAGLVEDVEHGNDRYTETKLTELSRCVPGKYTVYLHPHYEALADRCLGNSMRPCLVGSLDELIEYLNLSTTAFVGARRHRFGGKVQLWLMWLVTFGVGSWAAHVAKFTARENRREWYGQLAGTCFVSLWLSVFLAISSLLSAAINLSSAKASIFADLAGWLGVAGLAYLVPRTFWRFGGRTARRLAHSLAYREQFWQLNNVPETMAQVEVTLDRTRIVSVAMRLSFAFLAIAERTFLPILLIIALRVSLAIPNTKWEPAFEAFLALAMVSEVPLSRMVNGAFRRSFVISEDRGPLETFAPLDYRFAVGLARGLSLTSCIAVLGVIGLGPILGQQVLPIAIHLLALVGFFGVHRTHHRPLLAYIFKIGIRIAIAAWLLSAGIGVTIRARFLWDSSYSRDVLRSLNHLLQSMGLDWTGPPLRPSGRYAWFIVMMNPALTAMSCMGVLVTYFAIASWLRTPESDTSSRI